MEVSGIGVRKMRVQNHQSLIANTAGYGMYWRNWPAEIVDGCRCL